MNYKTLSNLKNPLRFFCPIILLVCISLTIARWHDIKGSYLIDADSLEQTTGTILSSEIKSINSKGSTSYHYSIQYEFQVNGAVFHSDEITFSYTGTDDGNLAEEYVRKYPGGKDVTVFYEIGNPSFSVLEPDVKDESYLLTFLIIGIFLSVIGLVLSFLPVVKPS